MKNALLVVTVVAGTVAMAAPRKDAPSPERQLAALKAQLAAERDSLQAEIASRWQARQRAVQRRESDKEELEVLRDRLERTYGELARIREECLVKERMAVDIGKEIDANREVLLYVKGAFADILAKEADGLMQVFPLDREQRRLDLEKVRRELDKSDNLTAAIDAFAGYHAASLKRARGVTLRRETIVPEQSGPVTVSLGRFGTVFAYGMSESGEVYVVRQSGQIGAERYRIQRISSSALTARVAKLLTSWNASGVVPAEVPVDVMLNEVSGMLMIGREATWWEGTMRTIRAGGAVMVPLLGVMVWAIVLTMMKVVQFVPRRHRDARALRLALEAVEGVSIGEETRHLVSCNGPVARVLKACLDAVPAGYRAVEEAARRAIARENTRLSAHLNTIAVIAGVAPLLGLLGTISGMINLFAAVTHYGTGDPKFLAGGISEALITSKTGLSIAIPLLFIHNSLRNAKERLCSTMEEHALLLLARVQVRCSGGPAHPAA